MIVIVVDTTCSLPKDLIKQLDLPLIPQIIEFENNESYRDDTEIDTATFLRKLRASTKLPKTAAPPPALYTPVYQKFAKPGNTLMVIAPSADVSGTVRSAEIAAQDFPGADIRIIDSRTIAGGLGQLVLQSVEWVKQGLDADTLESKIREMAARERVYFVVDTLEYLHKGGRIGGAKALMGSLLQLKPILMLRNGRTEPVETQRTKRKALIRLQELITQECPKGAEAHLSISHVEAEDEVKGLIDFFSDFLGIKDIPVYEVPPAIVVHAGPKVISTSFFVAPGAKK
jgi:DegV family protein with EDD domain